MKTNSLIIAVIAYAGSISGASALPGLTSFSDDFEPDIDQAMWTAFGGTVAATNHGGSVSGTNSLWFDGSGSRFAESAKIDTGSGGQISFQIRLGDGAAPFETADLPSEGVVLEYATEANTNWVELGRYDTVAFRTWTEVNQTLPIAAENEATKFRWRQLANSGTSTDNWALDGMAPA